MMHQPTRQRSRDAAVKAHLIALVPFTALYLIGITVFDFDFLALLAGTFLGSIFVGVQDGVERALTTQEVRR